MYKAADMLLFRRQETPRREQRSDSKEYTLRVSACAKTVGDTKTVAVMEFDAAITGNDPCMVSVGGRAGADPLHPCVLMLAYPDDDEVILESVGFDPDCCMPRGERGTVLMLQAALKFAMQEAEAAPGRASVALMDVSSRRPGDLASERCMLSCSDVHILKDPAMRSWYEKHLHATVDPSKTGALAAIRAALSSRVDSGKCTEEVFAKACARGAKLARVRAWLRHPGREEVLHETFRETAGSGTWSALVRSMIARLSPRAGDDTDEYGDSPDCPFVLKLLANILGSDEVCSGWASSCGWRWMISADVVAEYPVSVTWSKVAS
jgi:hypothetical protein